MVTSTSQISTCSCCSFRPSILLLQVIAPRVKAYLYTWGEPRYTIEGDRIRAKMEDVDIGYIDGMLLLPLVEEHNIDERSPLCGHTHESLMAVSQHLLLPSLSADPGC